MLVWNQMKNSFTEENWIKTLEAFVGMLEQAHNSTNGNWRVTLDDSKPFVRLQVANYISCTLSPKTLYVALDQELITPKLTSDLKALPGWEIAADYPNYKRGQRVVSTNINIFMNTAPELWEVAQPLASSFYYKVADMNLRYAHLHEAKIVELIESELGLDLPKRKI